MFPLPITDKLLRKRISTAYRFYACTFQHPVTRMAGCFFLEHARLGQFEIVKRCSQSRRRLPLCYIGDLKASSLKAGAVQCFPFSR